VSSLCLVHHAVRLWRSPRRWCGGATNPVQIRWKSHVLFLLSEGRWPSLIRRNRCMRWKSVCTWARVLEVCVLVCVCVCLRDDFRISILHVVELYAWSKFLYREKEISSPNSQELIQRNNRDSPSSWISPNPVFGSTPLSNPRLPPNNSLKYVWSQSQPLPKPHPHPRQGSL